MKKPKCVKAGGTSQPTLTAAITAAGANGIDPDRIELGPHTFDDGPWDAALNNPVAIVGAGKGKTTLRRKAAGDEQIVISLMHADSRIEKLKVALGQGDSVTGIQTRGTAADVRVTGSHAGTQTGVTLVTGRLERSQVTVGGDGTTGIGISMFSAGASASQVAVKAPRGVVGGAPSDVARLVRSRVTATAAGIDATTGHIVADNVLVRALGDADGVRASGASPGTSVTLLHGTVVGRNGNGTGVVSSTREAAGFCPQAGLVIRNSIVWGFETALARTGTPSDCVGSPTADLDVAWSALEARITGAGAGELRVGPGIITANPRFVAARKGNYRLSRRSPLIDRGQAGKPKKGESKRDLDGRKRVLNGDGKAGARRDIGAYEFKRKAKRKRKR